MVQLQVTDMVPILDSVATCVNTIVFRIGAEASPLAYG